MVVVTIVGSLGALLPSVAQASEFQTAIVRLDRMAKSTNTGGTVCLKPATAGSTTSVVVTFPSVTSPFTLDTSAGGWPVDTTADPDSVGSGNLYWPSGASSLTNVQAGTGDNTAKTATFSISPAMTLTVGTLYCFNFSAENTGVTGPTLTTGSTVSDALIGRVETNLDGSNVAFAILNTDGDQINVTAVVPPIFQFVLGGTTDTIPGTGNMDYSTTNTSAGVSITVHTNAKQGWIAWAKSANQGLVSASAGNYSVNSVGFNSGSPTALSPGTVEGYGLINGVAISGTSTCTMTVAPEYVASSNHAGAATANFQQIGACTGGTSDGDRFVLQERAAITITTPAAPDYTDTITVVGAGSF
jgi:hypothetical protein